MRTFIVLSLLLICEAQLLSQSVQGSLSYQYLNAKQLDLAIQAYNFSRPFLENDQPLLIHGIGADFGFQFKNNKRHQHGLGVIYSQFGSEAENNSYTNRIKFQLLGLDYIFHFSLDKKMKRTFGELHTGVLSSYLGRRINDESYLLDEAKSKSLGIGGNVGVKIGYIVFERRMHRVSVFAFWGYAPYIYTPKNENMINATQDFIISKRMNLFIGKIGLSYHFIKPK